MISPNKSNPIFMVYEIHIASVNKFSIYAQALLVDADHSCRSVGVCAVSTRQDFTPPSQAI